MKLYLHDPLGELSPLKRHLELEGTELVRTVQESDLVVNGAELQEFPAPTVGGTFAVPVAALCDLGFQPRPEESVSYRLLAWFDRCSGFHPQRMVSFRVHGLGPQGQGPRVLSGLGTRYVQTDDELAQPLQNPLLPELLRGLQYSGLVSVGVSGPESGVSEVKLGIAVPELYNLLEGCPVRLAEWLAAPCRVLESWVLGLVLSRFPWPSVTSFPKFVVEGLHRSAEKHCWVYGAEEFRGVVTTTSGRVAQLTCWGQTLDEANRRSLAGATALRFPDKMHRTDLAQVVGKQWGQVRQSKQDLHDVEA